MTRGLSIRAFLDDHYELVVAGLALVVLVGLFVTATTLLAPGTQDVERTTASWETTGTFAHQADVVGESEVFAGTLRNRTVYFTTVTPVLTGEQVFTYAGANNGSVAVETSARLVLRSTAESSDREIEYWRTSRTLNETRATDVAPGESVPVRFELDVSEIRNTTDEVESELGASGRTEAIVNVTVSYTGTIEGETVAERHTYSMPILVRGTTYIVLDDDPTVTPNQRSETVQVPEDYGPLRALGAPLLTILAGGLLAGLFYLGGGFGRWANRLELTPGERRYLEYRDDRAEFDDWISTVKLPPEAHEKPVAEASTLGDLVDFAIDTDNSVLEDPDGDAFYVVHDEYLYTYTKPQAPVDTGPLRGTENVLWERDSERPEDESGETERN